MDARLGALDDFGRREADAVVDDVHSRIERAGGDLLGAVRMAVEAGLADEELDPPAELERHPLDLAAQRVEIGRLLPGLRRNAGRRAELAEFGAQRVAPFAGRHARLGGLDRSGHHVDAARRRHAQRPQRLLDPRGDRELRARR